MEEPPGSLESGEAEPTTPPAGPAPLHKICPTQLGLESPASNRHELIGVSGKRGNKSAGSVTAPLHKHQGCPHAAQFWEAVRLNGLTGPGVYPQAPPAPAATK